jgi:hypothetical protein
MHFQVTSSREFNNIVKYLLQEVPEFSKSYNYDSSDGEYLVFAEFGRFLTEQMERGNMYALKQSFDFINNRVILPDYEVKNLFDIQIFELLLEKDFYIEVAKEHLIGEALERFIGMVG